MSKILIGTPFKDIATDNYIKSLADLIIYTQAAGHEVEYVNEHGGLFDARDRICQRTMREHFDYMLQIDSDMTFPPWTFKRLSELMDTGKSLVSGLYFGRRPPFGPIVYKDLQLVADGGAFPKPVAEVCEDFPEDTVFPAKAVGFGCVMLSVDLLKKVGAAYGTGFCPISGFGEDLSFCLRAGELGETVWVDSALKCGHAGMTIYTEDTWRAYRKRGEDA